MPGELEHVVVAQLVVDCGGQRRRVQIGSPVPGPGRLEHLDERAGVVVVAVGGQHVRDLHADVAGEGEECLGVRGGVDKQPLVPGTNEVAVVVHLGHRNVMQSKRHGPQRRQIWNRPGESTVVRGW